MATIIPIADLRNKTAGNARGEVADALRDAAPSGVAPVSGPAMDTRARPLRDLRISVTDRCNFRCSYCMPRSVFGPGFRFLPPSEILSFEELARVARVFVELGVQKLRLTGGEPLLRRGLPRRWSRSRRRAPGSI